jgi:tRNA(Ile)-lysidine synthase TilS/MesJ
MEPPSRYAKLHRRQQHKLNRIAQHHNSRLAEPRRRTRHFVHEWEEYRVDKAVVKKGAWHHFRKEELEKRKEQREKRKVKKTGSKLPFSLCSLLF